MVPPRPAPRPFVRRRLTETGLEQVLNEADRLGLLADPPAYESPQITDVGSTSVSFDVDAGTFRHVAYALGIDDERGARARLEIFVVQLLDVEGFVGTDNLGPTEPWVPDRYVVDERTAIFVEDTPDPDSIWPAGVPIESGCIELPIEQFPSGVGGLYAAQEDGRDLSVEVTPDLPGDTCT